MFPLHAWTPEYLQQTNWHPAIEKLKQQGKIRAWGLSANDWDPYNTVIPGMKRAAHVDENVKASDGVPLPADVAGELAQHAFVHGWSYPWAQK
jgi:aryl-alcohol dehydrogenase-like predicted oxidoreductase